MSMRSRKEGQRRPGFATAALVFAGTLFAYLALTVIPASAATVCTSTTTAVANDTMALAIGADDKIIVTDVAPNWDISINGGALAICAAGTTVANVTWINVTGSDAGAETVEFHNPALAFTAIATTVNLGNGTDTVIFNYAAIGAPALADAGNASFGLGVAGDGSVDGGSAIGGVGDFRIVGPENITINGSNTLGVGDSVNLSDVQAAYTGAVAPPSTADDIQATVGPVATGVTFNAGPGDDTLVSGDGADNFQGGPGADTVSYASASAGVTADLTAATGTGQGNDTLADVQNITGSAFADTLTGNTLDNVIAGGAGNDLIDGGTGNDTLSGDAGDDTINEGAVANGKDLLYGGTVGGVDVAGPSGLGDTIDYSARTGAVTIKAGGGAVSGEASELDTVDSNFENYATGAGNDTVVGSAGNALGFQDFLLGAGTNTLDGGAGGGDYLDLADQTGPAAITLSENAGTATSGTTSDTYKNIEAFVGTPGDDTLTWDGHQNLGTSAESRELFDFIGNGGNDTIDASSATVAVEVDMTEFSSTNGISNVITGSGDDEIVGNSIANHLTGGSGQDMIDGLGGNDKIEGGTGNDNLDTLVGNTGADTLVYTNASSGEKIDNQLGFATGGDGQDSIGFFAIILGSAFKDRIRAGQNAFSLNQVLKGAGGNDNLIGSNSSDQFSGGAGNDTIHGGGGDDTENGGAGNDVLYGSSGDDTLNGGAGEDTGWGGAGNDACHQVEHRNSC